MADKLKPEDRIEMLTKIIKKKPENAEVYFYRGNIYYNLKKYDEAIQDFNKAIELAPNYSYAYNSRGNVFSNQKQYNKAIQDYDKAIEIDPNYTKAYYNRGLALSRYERHKEAIRDYTKAIELAPNYNKAYYYRGNAFISLNQFEIAIQDYNKVIELEPNNEKALFFKGITLVILKMNEEAISCFDKISDNSSFYFDSQYFKGQALGSLEQPQKAILCFDKIPNSNDRYFDAQYFKGISFFILERTEDAAKSFVNAKKESFDILREFSDLSDSNEIEDVISKMLDYNKNDFFNVSIRHEQFKGDERNDYKKIYINALKIISLLHIENDNETSIAHYTKRATAAALLFSKDTKFRLNSTITANDPQEGETLLKYLNIEEPVTNKKGAEHDYQAFIGCFTFNHESLNQFRLYGKESDKEATGISLVLNKKFFNEKMDVGLLTNRYSKDDEKENANVRDDHSQKYALYRCIYVDPDTHKIISLGHKEEYSFYREFNNKDEKEIKNLIKEYKKDNDKIKKDINKFLNKLDKSIKKAIKKNLDQDVICELLLPLRYLVKHVAYKEEQECRIFDIKDLKDKSNEIKFTTNYTQMYIDYQPITNYVEKIFFAPKTEGVEIFKKAIDQEGLNIECEISSHPFS